VTVSLLRKNFSPTQRMIPPHTIAVPATAVLSACLFYGLSLLF
tara:strand:+ start:494 stop:622 length:129 start_codon:yes stop_codon:yes gene_type:complete